MPRDLTKLLGIQNLKESEPLSSHTDVQIGGLAEWYVEINSMRELIDTLKLSQQLDIPYFLLGTGYGTVIKESGIEGLVIKNLCREYEIANVSGKIRNGKVAVDKAFLYVESGTLLTQFVRFSLDKGYSGLEDFLGMPGTVGEAIRQNAMHEVTNETIQNSLKTISVLTRGGEIEEIDVPSLQKPLTRVLQENGYIILAAVFIGFPSEHTLLWEKANAASTYRAKIQEEGPTLGRTYADITQADAMRLPTPSYTTDVAYILDRCNIKGKKSGGAMVSTVNSNYLINTGNATSADFLSLMDFMQKAVYDMFRIRLKPVLQSIGK